MFNCSLCNYEKNIIVANKNQIRFNCYDYDKKIVKCLKCGLIQLYPMWNEQQLKKLYQKYSLKKDFKNYKYKKKIDYYIEKYLKKNDIILEIGAKSGENILYFKNKGYHITGIDKDPSICDGKNVLNYDFESMPDNFKFDFIYGIHVLEHITNPFVFLNKVKDILRVGGKFLFEIPNVDDPLLTIYNNKKYFNFYWYPFHIFFYNEKTIKKIFHKIHNFKINIEYKQRYGIINHLRWFCFGKPGNINFNIPVFDYLYKLFLTKILKKSDTLVIIGEKK